MNSDVDVLNTVKPAIEAIQGGYAASLLSSAVVFIFLLLNKIFDSSKKDLKEIKSDLKEEREKLQAIAISLEHLKGQMTLALSLPDELEELKKQVWSSDAKIQAAFRIIDKRRPSDQ